MKTNRLIAILLLACVLVSCGRQAPQRPSNRKEKVAEADSAQLSLMLWQQRLAEAADDELARYVQQSGDTFALYDNRTWMRICRKGRQDEPKIQRGEEHIVHMEIYDLKGQMLADIQRPFVIGKMELPAAADANMTVLNPGARVEMVAPWYMAYGANGTDGVPPYTNVLIVMEIQ